MRSLVIHPDGRREEVDTNQLDASRVVFNNQPLTMLGAIDDMHVFMVGLKDCNDMPVNTVCSHRTDVFLDDVIRGPVLFVATDDEGEPMDVECEAVLV